MAWLLRLGLRPARLVAIVLSWAGVALAAWCLFAVGPLSALDTGAWPVTFLVLLNRPSVRGWFGDQTGAG